MSSPDELQFQNSFVPANSTDFPAVTAIRTNYLGLSSTEVFPKYAMIVKVSDPITVSSSEDSPAGEGLAVRINSPTSAFGELTTADLKPFVQGIAAYNRIPANFRTYTATGGTAGSGAFA